MPKKFLITGGAGFIGTNYASRLIQRGEEVTIFDNLSRAGANLNVDWLNTVSKKAFNLIQADIRNYEDLEKAMHGIDVIVHLAGQVAVTTSVINPREDFEINAEGTFNVLEAARKSSENPIILYASTNKVYGGMQSIRVQENEFDYSYVDYPFGISEEFPLDFHSPYGCSKGTGDQYVRDYSRIYGLRSVVLRQSCIYGIRQFGIEDQGWIAWFIIALLTGKPITIYGNGKQVRDVLFIDDLLDFYDLSINNIEKTAGQIYNIGGGIENKISIWKEFSPLIEDLLQEKITVQWGNWRPGDQKIYISDIRKASKDLGWSPKINPKVGIKKLFTWVKKNKELIEQQL